MAGCEPRIGIWYAELYWTEVHKQTPVISVNQYPAFVPGFRVVIRIRSIVRVSGWKPAFVAPPVKNGFL